MSSPPFDGSVAVRATEEALSTTIDDEMVILHTSKGKYYGLNSVGRFIWNLIQEPQALDEICAAVTAEYDVEYDRCEEDVSEMITELAEKGLVTISES